MPDEEQDKNKKNLEAINAPKIPIENGDKKAFQEVIIPKEVTNPETDRKEESKIIIKKTVRRKTEKWNKADKISMAGFIVNFVMAILTFAALWVGYNSLKFSIESNKEADKNFEKTLKVTQQMARADSIAAEATKALAQISEVNTAIANHSLKTQINSIEENKKQFQIENRPFLQLGDFEISNFERTNNNETVLPIKFRVVNFGRFPAQILEVNYDNLLRGDTNAIDSIDVYKKKYNTNYNVTIGNVSNGGMPIDGTVYIEDWVYEKIQKNEWNYFLFGEIKYKCPTTGKYYKYQFIYRIQLSGYKDIKVLRNIDKELN